MRRVLFFMAAWVSACGGGGSGGGGQPAATSTPTSTATGAPSYAAAAGIVAQATPCAAVSSQPAPVQALINAPYVEVRPTGTETLYVFNTSDGQTIFLGVVGGKLTTAYHNMGGGATTDFFPACASQ